ncbi:MAG: 16S rRNA (cytosine(1402)-N(4))-methyltransferase RsmH [Syntrophothermus sp.]
MLEPPGAVKDKMPFEHVTVLQREAVDLLACKPGGCYVDCTAGGGGHTQAILERLRGAQGAEGHSRVIALDQDPAALSATRARLLEWGSNITGSVANNLASSTAGDIGNDMASGAGKRALLFGIIKEDFIVAGIRVTLVRANFARLAQVLEGLGIREVDGVLFDIGVSSHQLDEVERGFSYQQDAPLDMRMDPATGTTAADLVNNLPQEELSQIIAAYGEERWAKRIAGFIVERRKHGPISTTGELVDVIKAAIPAGARRGGPHPAKRTFQALRIVVNNELEALESGLKAAIEALHKGGRVCVITFHSLEDRIVKEIFKEKTRACQCPPGLPICVCGGRPVLKILTKKPVLPGAEELAANPRSRSAKLRAVERL